MHIWIVFKLVHILAVIVAVGANATYQFWYSRAAKSPEQMVWVINSVRALDRRVANPAYIVAAFAGAGIVMGGSGYTFEMPWIALSVLIYIAIAILGMAVYAPAMRRQAALAESAPGSADYEAAARRSRMLGMTAMGLVLIIIILMVTKPTL
jgi:uncharacterized membrane protein